MNREIAARRAAIDHVEEEVKPGADRGAVFANACSRRSRYGSIPQAVNQTRSKPEVYPGKLSTTFAPNVKGACFS